MGLISPNAYGRLKEDVAAVGRESRLEGRIGRYRLLREIGRGGMAVVYEAEDALLRRRVAIKVLRDRDADPQFVARLHREARIAAQLQHPNIVGIHEVGTAADEGGRLAHFIAMDLVDGPTLAQVIEKRSTDRGELLRMLEEVARAVAFAHSKGVVHRDLKPGNVLVDRAGRVLLTDFGLARGESAHTKLTLSNTVMGTPQYMAPEQVRGEQDRIDARTDVYALGVMLYEILSGGVPFDGATPARVYAQILEEEPRMTSVPRDLEVVCLKAMEKEPDRRYAGAGEFAEELARFRRGEPVVARPPSLVERVRRKLARRKVLVGAIAAVALAAIVAAVLWIRLGAERARALEQLVKRTQTALAAALDFRRTGRPAAMQRYAEETEAACREMMRDYPELAEPHYRLGRMYRALMREPEAMAQQDEALKRDPEHGLALYERIVLRAGLYRARMEELRALDWRDQDPRGRELRAHLEADAARLESLPAGVGPGERAAAGGLLAWVRSETARARELFDEAKRLAPGLEEVHAALASLALDESDYARSIALWSDGLREDEGCAPHLDGRGFAQLLWGLERFRRGEDFREQYAAAAADFGRSIALAQNRADPWLRRGLLGFLRSDAQSSRGEGPEPACRAAIEDLARARGLAPADHRGWMWSGAAHAALMNAMTRRGADAATVHAAGLEHLDRACALASEVPDVFMWRAIVRAGYTTYLVFQGRDPEPLYRDAERDLETALSRSPGAREPRLWRGGIYAGWVSARLLRGEDARELFERAVADLTEAIEKKREQADAWARRGGVRAAWAQHLVATRQDPGALLREAEEDLEAALARNGRLSEAWASLGRVSLARALQEASQGRDPEADYGAAVERCTRALELNAGNALARQWRAAAYEWRGRMRERAGRPAAEEFRRALADYEELVRGNALYEPHLKAPLAYCRERAR